jgi:hypothetical protein
MEATGVFIKEMCILYAYKLSLKVSSKCIHPNYYFYCFECVDRVCPNLSSAPCILYSTLKGGKSEHLKFLKVILKLFCDGFSPFFCRNQGTKNSTSCL